MASSLKTILSSRNVVLLLVILVALFLGSLNWVQPWIHKEGLDEGLENEDDEEDEEESDKKK